MAELSKSKSKWATADSYNLHAFEQVDGAWPIGHPLPLPKWTNHSKERLVIDKVTLSLVAIKVIRILN